LSCPSCRPSSLWSAPSSLHCFFFFRLLHPQ
jgi:hypothetical protein